MSRYLIAEAAWPCSAEMTRKYQRRRDRFRVNLTKASGFQGALPKVSGSNKW